MSKYSRSSPIPSDRTARAPWCELGPRPTTVTPPTAGRNRSRYLHAVALPRHDNPSNATDAHRATRTCAGSQKPRYRRRGRRPVPSGLSAREVRGHGRLAHAALAEDTPIRSCVSRRCGRGSRVRVRRQSARCSGSCTTRRTSTCSTTRERLQSVGDAFLDLAWSGPRDREEDLDAYGSASSPGSRACRVVDGLADLGVVNGVQRFANGGFGDHADSTLSKPRRPPK